MENILGILTRISQNYEDTTNKHLATVIMSNFIKGHILPLKNLSVQLNCSEGLITMFCQKIGFEGYRDFNKHLKIEYEKYFLLNKDENIELSISKMLDKYGALFNDLKLNETFFNNLISKLQENKNLTIFSSYQSSEVADFISNLLTEKGYNCKIFKPNKSNFLNIDTYFDNTPVFLFLLTGSDNGQITSILKKIDANLNTLFLVTTNGQKDIVGTFENKFIITSHYQYNNYFYRRVLLETLFLVTFDIL